MNIEQEKTKKNSDARIKANNKYAKSHYKNISIKIRPDQAEYIRDVASKNNLSIAQLILNSVTEYDNNHKEAEAEDEENEDF